MINEYTLQRLYSINNSIVGVLYDEGENFLATTIEHNYMPKGNYSCADGLVFKLDSMEEVDWQIKVYGE